MKYILTVLLAAAVTVLSNAPANADLGDQDDGPVRLDPDVQVLPLGLLSELGVQPAGPVVPHSDRAARQRVEHGAGRDGAAAGRRLHTSATDRLLVSSSLR